MDLNFASSLTFTLTDEGGNVDDKRDPGGRTSRGVTQRTYDAACKKYGWTSGDVWKMSQFQLQQIYHDQFWVPVGGPSLAMGLDYSCFDFGVNSGPARGKSAAAKVAKLDTISAIKAVNNSRTSFVNGIKNFATFRKGVLARVARVEARSLKMAGTNVTISTAKVQAEAKVKNANFAAKVTAGPAAATAGVSPGVVDWHSFAAIATVGCLVLVLGALGVYFIYQHAKHSARVDALASV